LRLNSPGSATVWMDGAPATNGTVLSLDGRLLTADESTYQIRSHIIGESGPVDTIVLGTTPKKPNDLVQLTNGNIYYTCPDWNGVGPSGQGVYRLEPNGVSTRAENTLWQPNGIMTSLDETKLYVAESSSSDNTKKRWWVFPINPDGTLGSGTVFFKPSSPPATNDPDGMTIDEWGNLYFTGLGGVWIVSPTGQQLDMIPVATYNCSNICFGGPNGRTLYITCNVKVYSLAMTVRGGE
jgi:gluconolactonase